MSDMSEIAKREYEGESDNLSVNCSDINEDDSSRYTNLNENNSKPYNETEYCNIDFNSVEDMKCNNEGNTAKASTSEKGDVQHDSREIPNKESKEYESEHFKPQSNVEHFALASESPATSNLDQGSIEYTPDIMEVFSTISSQPQRTVMHSISTKSYPNGQEVTDIISTSTTEDNILDLFSGKDDFHQIDENHLIDIPDFMKTYKDDQIPNLMDIKSKSDTNVVNNDHEQSNKTNNGTSNLLFGRKEFSGEKEIENCKIQDMSAMFCEGNVADNISAKHTKSQSNFSCYQQLSGDQDSKDIASKKLSDFSDAFQEETQEELRGSCSHHIGKGKLDPTETIINETNSEGLADVSSVIDNESVDEMKSRICKLNSNGDKYVDHVNVFDPSIPMTMSCSISDGPAAVNDLTADKNNLDGEKGGTSIKMQEYGIGFESNQQTVEEKGMNYTQKLHAVTHHSLEYDGDYTGKNISENESPDNTHISMSVGSEKEDVLCHDYTVDIQEDAKVDPKNEVEMSLNNMQTTAPTTEHIHVNSTAVTCDENKDNISEGTSLGVNNEKNTKRKKKMQLFPIIFEGKKGKNEVSALFPDNATSEVVLSMYPNGQELTDIISTSTTEDNILDLLSGKDDFHKIDENHLIDIPDVMKTYKDEHIPNLMDIKSKSDTSDVYNDHMQSNETNNGTSNLLFGHKEFSGEKEIENCKIQDMSATFCEGNVSDNMFARHTKSESSFSCYQQLSGDQDSKDIASKKLSDFSDAYQEETQEELSGSCSHHIGKGKLDPTETIKNKTNSEGLADVSSVIDNESVDEMKSRICKLNSNGDKYDSHVNVFDPSIPMTMSCSISDGPAAVNDLTADKNNLDGEKGGTSIKMQEYGIGFESNQQTVEEKGMNYTQKLHEVTHHSLEYDGDYTGKNISENESPDNTHISMSVGSEKEDVLCHDYTVDIQEDAKVDPKNEVEMSLNNMQTTAPTTEHIHVNSTAATCDENKDNISEGTSLGVNNEKNTKRKKKMQLFPIIFGGKKGKHEVSTLFPDNATSEVVLSKYTDTQTELSISLQDTQTKHRSILNSFKRLSRSQRLNEQSMIDFGKRCEECLSRPFENMNDDEIRCLKCFRFECKVCETQCICGETCYCKLIGKTIEEKMERAKKILRESINGRLPNEDTIYIVSTHCYYLHNGKTTLTLELRLSKHFEEKQNDNKSTQSQENLIKILVLDYEDPSSRKYLRSRQAVCVTLKTVVEEKVIGLYSKDMTGRQEEFIRPLIRYLDSRYIQVQKVDAFYGKLGKQDAQLIVVCLVHSRAMSDVNAALCKIEDKFYKQIILVLLHFKQSDKRECASELKSDRRYSEIAIIDLFQQPESDNKDDVFKKIIDAINSY